METYLSKCVYLWRLKDVSNQIKKNVKNIQHQYISRDNIEKYL